MARLQGYVSYVSRTFAKKFLHIHLLYIRVRKDHTYHTCVLYSTYAYHMVKLTTTSKKNIALTNADLFNLPLLICPKVIIVPDNCTYHFRSLTHVFYNLYRIQQAPPISYDHVSRILKLKIYRA